MEGLEEVILDNARPELTTRVRTLASLPVRQVFTTFLRENLDMFAWSHEDISKLTLRS